MYAQTATTGSGRMGHETKMMTMSNARAFLARVQVDDVLAAKLADADGDMPAILALAEGASLGCSARELATAYEELLRDGSAEPGLGAPSDMSHPAVYMTLGAPSDFGYPIVYLSRSSA